MNQRMSLFAVGFATSALFVITYLVCVGFEFLFPELGMLQGLLALLPGFFWISWPHFFLGMVESYGYGWYIALIWVPVYNFVVSRRDRQTQLLEGVSRRA